MYIAAAETTTHEGARQMMTTALDEARGRGLHFLRDHVDAGGHLIVLERMDGGRFPAVAFVGHQGYLRRVRTNVLHRQRCSRTGCLDGARGLGIWYRSLNAGPQWRAVCPSCRWRMYRRRRSERRRLRRQPAHCQGGGGIDRRKLEINLGYLSPIRERS